MAVDRRALAYAQYHCPIFVSRYIAAARAGRSDVIPQPIRDAVEAYVDGRRPSTAVDVNAWVESALYEFRVRNGRDADLPPEFGSVGKAAMQGAVKGAAVGLGIASTLFRLFR